MNPNYQYFLDNGFTMGKMGRPYKVVHKDENKRQVTVFNKPDTDEYILSFMWTFNTTLGGNSAGNTGEYTDKENALVTAEKWLRWE
jgi:hypothetical protein